MEDLLMSTEPTSKPPSPTWDDVRRLADEVKLKVHLAGMDLKDRWKALEPEFHNLEEKVRATGEKAESMLSAQAEAIGASLRKLADELRESLNIKK
jgi:hypothetical protein